jgi:hypothetical protein
MITAGGMRRVPTINTAAALHRALHDDGANEVTPP